MFYKPLSKVDLNDLQLLVSNKVKEGTQLDYKLIEPDKNDDGKKEFLRDVSAFANTNGGYLIYGIQEEEISGKKTGIAEKVVGIEGLNTNELQLWMENLIRTSIEPRLVGLEFQEISISTTHAVLIVRIPRSWNLPHVISFGKHWRFYARNSAGNYPMDVTQLRDSFISGSTIPEKLEEKRNEKLSVIKQKYQIGKTESLPILVIHIQPFESLRADYLIDTSKAIKNLENLILGSGEKYDPQYNFDGLIFGQTNNYLQISRSGVTEELNTTIFGKTDENEKFIHVTYLQWIIFKGIGWRLALLKNLGIDSPLMVQVSLLGVHNYKLKVRTEFSQYISETILPNFVDRADLITNSIFIESLSNLNLEGNFTDGNSKIPNCWKTSIKIVKPIFDSIWNAFGMERCLYYDKDENFRDYISNYFPFHNNSF